MLQEVVLKLFFIPFMVVNVKIISKEHALFQRYVYTATFSFICRVFDSSLSLDDILFILRLRNNIIYVQVNYEIPMT